MKARLLSFLGALLVFAVNATAGPVTKAEAEAEARLFMLSKGLELSGDMVVTSGPRRTTASREESSCYYVFNNGQNGGFVIVSGDDRTKDILAYSETGSLDMDNLPDNVRYMLDCYEAEISHLDEILGDTPVTRRAYAETPATNPVLPLLTCSWDQSEPFNNSCPAVNGEHTKAGCIPVAVAQVLYFYRDRMPAKLPVTIPSYLSGSRTMSAVNAGTAFYWSRMFNKDDGTQTSAQLTSVANLILYVGKALKSSYSLENTSTLMSSVKTGLTNYFDFNSNADVYSRSDYTTEQWEAMVVSELEDNRPVVYGGRTLTGGHAFVVDGYDGRGLFHVNWGWGGECEGYFSLSIMNPYDLNGYNAAANASSYTYDQTAYFNLQPNNGYSYTAGAVELTSTITSVSSNTVKVSFKNLSSSDGKFKCGLGYLDEDGFVQKLMESDAGETTVAASSSMGSVAFKLSASDFKPSSGTVAEYKLYPIYLLSGEKEWTQCPNTSSNYIQVNYKNGAITSSLVEMTASIKATDFVFTGSCTKSVSQPVNFKLTNSGDKDFTGYIYLFASTKSTKGSARSKIRVILPKGETNYAMLSFTPTAAAKYNVWIATDASASKVLGSTTVTITASQASKNLKVLSVTPENTSASAPKIVYGDEFKGVAKIQNVSTYNYNDMIVIWLSINNSYKYYMKYQVSILAGETVEVPFDFGELDKSKYYGLGFYYNGSDARLTNGSIRGFTLKDGLVLYAGDGTALPIEVSSEITVGDDVAAVSMRGVANMIDKVVPNSNPNTLYIFDEDETVPDGLEGKNIVKGNTAASIVLEDGYEFYSPVTFVADEISYTRVPQIGATGQGDGWESLVVPFNVDKLMYSKYQLGWFTSDSDTGKNLWVKKFSGIKGYSTVCFDYTDEILANRPYIMAVPSNHWGEAYNLTGKKLEFKASNATVIKDASLLTGSKVYNYRGTYYYKKLSNIFCLDETGSNFIQGTSTVKPFHCYFVSSVDGSDDQYGNMDIVTSVKGIMMPFASENDEVSVYNISGIKVGTTKVVDGRISLDGLQKGIYIINGHKFIK